jgi:hypothetical protein
MIALTLAALADVGNAPVTVRLDPAVFPPPLLRDTAARYDSALAVASDGALTVSEIGPDAWESLRRFAQDLLLGALEHQ